MNLMEYALMVIVIFGIKKLASLFVKAQVMPNIW